MCTDSAERCDIIIRLLVGKYSLEQKKSLYMALLSGLVESKCGQYRSPAVEEEIEKAAEWLAREIERGVHNHAQNR